MTAFNSGHNLGGCIWRLMVNGEDIVYAPRLAALLSTILHRATLSHRQECTQTYCVALSFFFHWRVRELSSAARPGCCRRAASTAGSLCRHGHAVRVLCQSHSSSSPLVPFQVQHPVRAASGWRHLPGRGPGGAGQGGGPGRRPGAGLLPPVCLCDLGADSRATVRGPAGGAGGGHNGRPTAGKGPDGWTAATGLSTPDLFAP